MTSLIAKFAGLRFRVSGRDGGAWQHVEEAWLGLLGLGADVHVRSGFC